MPSRKRNKGRDRKAKKVALEVEKIEKKRRALRTTWQCLAHGVDLNGQSIECNHGVDLMIPDEDNHPVINFIDELLVYGAHENNNVHVGQYLRDTFTTHQEVWDNERYREMTVNIFLAIGTNFMLRARSEHASVPRNVAMAVVALENYDGSGAFVVYNRVASTKMRDLLGGHSLRDMLKFFRKRTSCKCLKDMHLQARNTLPKVGMCYHCHEVKDDALLMVCSRCGVSQYCSRECQMAHWPSHKCRCDAYIRVQNQQSKYHWHNHGRTVNGET